MKWSKILQYNLLQYEDYPIYNSNNNNEIVSNYDDFVTPRDYDRTITATIQTRQYSTTQEKQQDDRRTKTKTKTIMVVDDDPDTTLTFKKTLEAENYNSTIEIYTYNSPVLALSEFKPNFYNLLLIDVNMPKMNGFELCMKILEIDANPRICFMSSADINHEGLREVYPAINIGCFIKKPVSTDYLVRKVRAELE